MTTIEEIVASMMGGSPDHDKPMTLKLAAIDVRNLKADYKSRGETPPKELTVRNYWETWNDILSRQQSAPSKWDIWNA